LRELAKRGFEIGLHASYESYRSTARLASEKQQIESAVGVPLGGIRQHFLRFDVSSTWAAQGSAGFDYDSTLGYNEAIGFRAGIAAPFRPWNTARRAPHDVLELPLAVMDGALFRTLGLDGGEAARRTIALLEAVEAAEGLAVLLWHPNGADAVHYPGWWDSYREVLAHLSARSAWVATGGEMNGWWREREKAVLGKA
jgi:peptidoglycan/xylan/chitin deacetylase (PgdA/CDA1 family)